MMTRITTGLLDDRIADFVEKGNATDSHIFSNTRGKVGSSYGLTSDLRRPVFRERGEIHAGGEIGPAGPF